MKDAYGKAAEFCAYQERTQQEVRDKLYSLNFKSDDIEQIIGRLIIDNFINEERFAITYASGKFRQNKWGRIKIKAGLKSHGLSDYCINKGLTEIDLEEYKKMLLKLIKSKESVLPGKRSNFIQKNKIASFLIGKGYESDLVWKTLNDELY